MSNTKHTPGPWKVFNHSWSDTSIIAPGFDHGICCLDINHATEESQEADEEQMAANARLIAAAPDLLETLRLCEGNIYSLADAHPVIFTKWLKVVRAAIAKAEGA